MKKIEVLAAKIDKLKGAKEFIVQDITEKEHELISLKTKLIQYEQAKEILKSVALKTQEQLRLKISDITSLALEAVFPEPYKLVIEFVERRGKTECDIFFERDGNLLDPLDSSGGGTVDIASFALRIVSWVLQGNLNNVIILDEPMRFLSEDLRPQGALMLKEISNKLNLQFIIITHDPQFTTYADKIFEIKKNKAKISKIKTHSNLDNYGNQ